MAANPVEIAQLQVIADYFLTATYPYFEELREAFKLLRLTGCRIQEIFEIYRWNYVSGYTVVLQPQKGNNTRTIILNSEFNSFLAAVQNQYNPFTGRTYSQLQYLFNKINPYGKLYSSTKEITNYFFRYLYIRELDADGFTLAEIAEIMGYTSTTAVHNYLDAVLSSTIEVPVTPPDPLPEGHIDIIPGPTIFTGVPPGFRVNRPNTSDLVSMFVTGTRTMTTQRFILYPGDISVRALGFIVSITTTPTVIQFSYSVMNGPGIFVFQYSINSFLISPFKFVFTFDISQLSGLNPLIRNIYFNVYVPNKPVNSHTKTNFSFSRGWQSMSTICGSYNNGVYGNIPFVGEMIFYSFWNRILTTEEINVLLNQ